MVRPGSGCDMGVAFWQARKGGGVGHDQINFSTVICYIPMQPLPLADLLTVTFC